MRSFVENKCTQQNKKKEKKTFISERLAIFERF